MGMLKVICNDSSLDTNGKERDYAIYKKSMIENGFKLVYCNFSPHFFPESISKEEFDVEFAFNDIEEVTNELW